MTPLGDCLIKLIHGGGYGGNRLHHLRGINKHILHTLNLQSLDHIWNYTYDWIHNFTKTGGTVSPLLQSCCHEQPVKSMYSGEGSLGTNPHEQSLKMLTLRLPAWRVLHLACISLLTKCNVFFSWTVPPPENVTVSCNNFHTTVYWNYSELLRQPLFKLKINSDLKWALLVF